MKILNASQIQAADAYTIAHEPISSLDLMERASLQALKVLKQLPLKGPYHIVCGSGNNAGDGLVMARYLHQMGEEVKVYTPSFVNGGSTDFEINRQRFTDVGGSVETVAELPPMDRGVIVDAVFGTGLNRPLEGDFRAYVSAINKSNVPIVAIDVPSGLMIDSETISSDDVVVYATFTLTFMQPKYAFFFPNTGRFAGKFIVIDIGWHKSATEGANPSLMYVDGNAVQSMLRSRSTFYYKQMAGHALLIGGSSGMPGAIALAAKACMRIGAGLTTVHTVSRHASDLAAQLPDVMWQVDKHADFISEVSVSSKINGIGVGPGLGTEQDTANALKRLIQDSGNLTLDADAINILAENPTWLAFLPKDTVITPHPGEMQRLLKTSEYTLEDVKAFAVRFKLVVVLKGAFTFTVTPSGQVFVNSTGTPALSVAGSGDVLTGMIVGLRVQGYGSVEAAVIANYLHGMAARFASDALGVNSVMASDVIESIPRAYSAV